MNDAPQPTIRRRFLWRKFRLSPVSEQRWLDCGLEIADLYVLLTLGRKLNVTSGTWYCFEEAQIPPGAEEQLRHLVGFSVLLANGQIQEIGRTISFNPELP
jgi:hypothetical protein